MNWTDLLLKYLQPQYKHRFILGFVVVVVSLAVIKRFTSEPQQTSAEVSVNKVNSLSSEEKRREEAHEHPEVARRWKDKKHRILSVSSFKNTFPDMNDVQLVAAKRYGVKPVRNRAEAEHRMKELVYVGSDPYFHVDPLNTSIPYLVPRAAVLVHDIGRAFFDSLYVKGIPLHKIIVTSVTRTKDDIARLQRGNGNATENSCHLYGTTVDICYNRYKTVEPEDGPSRRAVRNDSLKWVLSEVLRDFRQSGRCYVKYEVKQGCFHLTVN